MVNSISRKCTSSELKMISARLSIFRSFKPYPLLSVILFDQKVPAESYPAQLSQHNEKNKYIVWIARHGNTFYRFFGLLHRSGNSSISYVPTTLRPSRAFSEPPGPRIGA